MEVAREVLIEEMSLEGYIALDKEQGFSGIVFDTGMKVACL